MLHQIGVRDWWSSLRHSLGAKPAAANRRGEQRLHDKIAIQIRNSEGVIYRGFSRDLSRTGMGAIAAAPLKLGDEVWILYDHPVRGEPPRHVVRRAKVCQRRGYRYGFAFDVPMDL